MSNDLYWEFENGNKFSKNKFSYEAAEAYSRTLVNCKDCVNCKFCLDCIGCEGCINCIN